MSALPKEVHRQPTMPVTIADQANAKYVAGRRAFFKYRDLGITDATAGRMRAQITSTKEGLTEPTGWHYHTCDIQFVYVTKGWVELEFEDGGLCVVKAGDSVMIPGYAKHQETRTSTDLELLEISLPAEMGTVACDAPAGK